MAGHVEFRVDKLYWISEQIYSSLDFDNNVNKCHSDVTRLYYTDDRLQMEGLYSHGTYAFTKRELYEILRG